MDLVQIKELDFAKCFKAALQGQLEKDRQQYYPDQTLLAVQERHHEQYPQEQHPQEQHPQEQQHSVHLSINSIANVKDPTDVYGALV